MARIRQQDWVDAGLALLKEQGGEALTLERLCRKLKKTKGSFYHHFADMNAYVGKLLECWREKQTQIAIDIAEKATDPNDRLELLDQTVRQLDHRLDQIIRSWALRDSRAARALIEVDGLRVGYLKKLLQETGLSAELAATMAELEYTAFLGAQQRFEDLNAPAARKISQALHDAMNLLAKQ